MNICMVTPSMPIASGAFVGGSVNGMIGLLKGLDIVTATKVVITGAHYDEARVLNVLRPAWATEVVPISLVSTRNNIISAIELIIRLPARSRQLNKGYRITIVHGHSGYALHSMITLVCARALGVPAVHTLYCPLAKHINDKRSWLLNESLVSLVLKRLDRTIAISHNVARSLLAAGIPAEKVRIIPPPVELDRFDPELYNASRWRERLGIPLAAPLILFGGNNTTQAKGLDVFLEAMPRIAAGYSDAVFVWTLFKNEKPLEIREKLERWGLQNNVRQFGIVDNMPEIMAAADVVVAPFSSTEGPADYPLMLLEAMAMGKAIVTTPVGGISEVVDHGRNGLLVNPGRPDEVAEAVLLLLRDKGMRSRLSQVATETVRRHFAPEFVARQVIEVYEEVLVNSGMHRHKEEQGKR